MGQSAMRNRSLLSALLASASVTVLAIVPASAVKKSPYPEVKIEVSEAFQPDAAFDAMRQAFSAAATARNADALFALVGPTFVWTAEGGPTDEFDMGRGPVDNFKAVFGFRAPRADKDGGVDGGPFWDGLAAFAA